MRASPFTPKYPAALRWTLIVLGVSTIAYAAAAWFWPWRPGRGGGLVFGTLAALLFLNAALYPGRRRWRARPWRTVQQWLQLHIYGSVAAAWFVLLHMGFHWPVGQLGWWLFGLSVWTTVTGLAGVALQKWLPIVMSRDLRVEAIYERIPDIAARLRQRADSLVAGQSDAIRRFYDQHVRAVMAAPNLRWAYILDARASQDPRLSAFQNVAGFLPADDRGSLDALEAVVIEKLELDASASLQRWLRVWLLFHVPAAIVLMALLAVHIVAVWLF